MHSINCPCPDCEKIRATIKKGVESGKVNLIGLESDKKKIMGGKS